MEKRGQRRRIIDSTSVPNNRRKERRHSYDGGDTDCSRTTSDDALNKCNDCKVTNEEISEGARCIDKVAGHVTDSILQRRVLNDTQDNLTFTERNVGFNKNTDDEDVACLQNERLAHGSHVESEVCSHHSELLNKEQTGARVIRTCEHENDVAGTCNLDFTDEESILADLVNLLGTKQTETQGATMNTKPWMLPTRHMIKESLFPAIPEEIHRELIDRNFMLPWNSIDQNETYKISKHSRRISAHTHSAKSERRQPKDEAGISIERNWSIIPETAPGRIYADCNKKETERRDSFSLELIEKDEDTNDWNHECNFQKTNVKDGLETKDPYSIELEKTNVDHDRKTHVCQEDLVERIIGCVERTETESPLLDIIAIDFDVNQDDVMVFEDETEEVHSSLMAGQGGAPRLLSVEEKWQIIFNEKTRAPIFAVAQYIEYLQQYVKGQGVAPKDNDRISPISYLLRKLKLDLKMSYDSFVEEFLKPGNNGLTLLVKLLKFIQNTGTQQSGSTNKAQLKTYKKTLTDEHDCLLCIKFALRIKTGLTNLLEANYGLETIAMSLVSSFTKSRGTAIEILTVALAASEGFSRTLDSFTYVQLKIGEPVRFKSLMNMMNNDSQHNTIFKVSCMKFLNCLLNGATNLNVRVFLQHELETAGLDVTQMTQRTTGMGLEYDELRHELSEWTRKYIRVEELMSQRNLQTPMQDTEQQGMIEELQRQVKMLTLEKTTLEHQLLSTRESLRNSNEELQRRQSVKHKSSQATEYPKEFRDESCQCPQPEKKVHRNPLFDVEITGAWQASSSLPTEEVPVAMLHIQPGEEEVDEHGVEKVQQWLNSQSDVKVSSNDITHVVTDNKAIKRQKSLDGIVRKAEFPGNWRLVPKSLGQFPSRFPKHQCHRTNCDRCDIRNRPENMAIRQKQETVVQTVTAELHHEDIADSKKRLDVKSESSDSAIGGSGDRWQTKDNRIPLLAPEVNEAEILQDMIEPDDSASGCRSNEPFPDYSVVSARLQPQNKSFRSELSEVLREFEGNLNEYESSESFQTFNDCYNGHFVTLGQV